MKGQYEGIINGYIKDAELPENKSRNYKPEREKP